jgi:amino acid transporter
VFVDPSGSEVEIMAEQHDPVATTSTGSPGLGGLWNGQRGHLRRDFHRFDVLFFLVCTLVGLDTIGSAAAGGPQGLVWLVVLAVVFFLPYGLMVAELGTTFPVEGGPYVWTKLAFGRMAAAVNQFLYWFSNPLWIGGSLCIVAITTFETFFVPLPGVWKYVAGLVFIWAGVLAVLLVVRVGKWLPTIGAVARLVLLTFFAVSVVVYGVRNGVQPLSLRDFTPTYAGFVGLVPVLIFNYVGFELPSTASEEMADARRDVPFAVLRSGLAAFLLYGGPIVGILLVLPGKAIGSLGGFIDAVKAVFTVYGGSVAEDGTVTLTGWGQVLASIAAAGLILGVLTSGITWAMGGDRAQAVACADGAGPAWFGRISPRFGTPVRVNVFSGVLASVVMVVAFVLSEGSADKYFAAGLGLAISTNFISYVVTFPALAVLRRTLPDVARPYRVPGGRAGAWIVAGVTTAMVLYTVVVLIWPGFGIGWFGTGGDPAASLPKSFSGQRWSYTLSQVVPLVAIVAAGFAAYAAGAPTRRAERESLAAAAATED